MSSPEKPTAEAVGQVTPKWLKTVDRLSTRHADAFGDFVTLAACVCACGAREAEYLRVIRRYDRPEQAALSEAFADVLALKLADPFLDVFGAAYMEQRSNRAKQHMGEFYTPDSIGALMARLTMRLPEPGRTLTLAEPACGSGLLILEAARALVDLGGCPLHLQVQATDLSFTAVDMTLVNLGLAGIPALVRRGNSITNEVFATYETPAWRFAQPYSGQPGEARLRPRDVLTMLHATVPPPAPSAPVPVTPPAALHDAAAV